MTQTLEDLSADYLNNTIGANGQTLDASPCRPRARCSSRVCPDCQRVEQWRIQQRLLQEINNSNERQQRRYHIILTLPATDNLLGSCRQLLSAAKQLRRLNAWKPITGGFQKIEANHKRQWSAHVHCLAVTTEPLNREALIGEWYRLTEGRAIVKSITTETHLDNCLSYLAAPAETKLEGEALHAFIRGTRGLRLKQLIGEWRGRPLFKRKGI